MFIQKMRWGRAFVVMCRGLKVCQWLWSYWHVRLFIDSFSRGIWRKWASNAAFESSSFGWPLVLSRWSERSIECVGRSTSFCWFRKRRWSDEKKDLVSALVNVCPDLDKEAKQKIIGSISGDAPQREAEPTGLIRAVSCLDAKDQDLFEPLVKACVKELEIRHGEEVQSSKENLLQNRKILQLRTKRLPRMSHRIMMMVNTLQNDGKGPVEMEKLGEEPKPGEKTRRVGVL